MMQLAIIGCGAVVEELYLPALQQGQRNGYFRVACLVDTNPKRLGRLRCVFPQAALCEKAEDAYSGRKIDLTLITSPPGSHAHGAAVAFDHASHVLCEKPLASSLEEAERMTAQAKAQGLLLAVGFVRRLYPNLCKARQLIVSNALGKPLRFLLREGKVYNWPVISDAPFRRGSGGGVLLDIGAHVMDTLCWFFGPPRIRSFQDDACVGGVDSNGIAEMEFPDASGTFQLSWDQPLASALTVSGSRAQLRIPAWEMHAWQWCNADGLWSTYASDARYADDLALPSARLRHPAHFEDCIYLQLIQVLRAIKYSEPLLATGEDALVSMRALHACQAMAEPLQQEWLEESERAAFRQVHWRTGCMSSANG
jgi:predicted dehydrogenase